MEALRKGINYVKEAAAKIDIRAFIEEFNPLLRAVADRNAVVLEELLRRGEDPDDEDQTPYGFSAAHWAALMSGEEILMLLDRYGANMSAVDDCDMTPLHVAALAGNSVALSWLLNNTCDIEAKEGYDQTPLHQAAFNGRLEAVKILLNSGASMEVVDSFGMTPLCLAVVRGFGEVVKFLLDRGADHTIRDVCQKTLLHAAAAGDDFVTISCLLEKGIAIDVRDKFDCTPLHDAAKLGTCKAISLLLEHGAEIYAKDYKGYTPLDKAKKAGNESSVRLLLQHVAIPTMTSEDKTQLEGIDSLTENSYSTVEGCICTWRLASRNDNDTALHDIPHSEKYHIHTESSLINIKNNSIRAEDSMYAERSIQSEVSFRHTLPDGNLAHSSSTSSPVREDCLHEDDRNVKEDSCMQIMGYDIPTRSNYDDDDESTNSVSEEIDGGIDELTLEEIKKIIF